MLFPAPEPVTDLAVSEVTSEYMIVTWTPISECDFNGKNIEYILKYSYTSRNPNRGKFFF